jgi:hypothetical protein
MSAQCPVSPEADSRASDLLAAADDNRDGVIARGGFRNFRTYAVPWRV